MVNLKTVKSMSTSAAKQGKRGGGNMPDVSDVTNFMPTAGSAPDFTGKTLGKIATYSGHAFMASAFLPPLLFGGSSGVTRFSGNALNYVGARGVGGSLLNTSEKISKFNKVHLEDKLLSQSRWGRGLARFAHNFMNIPLAVTAGFNNISGGMFSKLASSQASKAAMFGEQAAAHAAALTPHLSVEARGHLNELLTAAAGNHIDAYGEAGEALHDALGSADKGVKKLVKQIKKSTGKQMKFAEKAMGSHSMATGKHNTYEAVAGANVKKGVSHYFLATGAAAETALMIKDTMSDAEAMRSMVADIKNLPENEVTSGDVLFGDLPYAGQVARKAFLTSAAPRTILETINQTFNVKWVMGKDVPMALFLLPMGLSMGVGMLTSGNILDVYKEMKQNEKNGQANTAEDYAKLIGLTNKNLHNRLGSESNFAKEVGRIYATKHVSVKQALIDAQDGVVDELIEHIKSHNIGQEALAPAPSVDEIQKAAHTDTPSSEVNQLSSIHSNANLGIPDNALPSSTSNNVPMENFVSRVSQPSSFTESVRST